MSSQTTTTKYEGALVEPRDNQLRKRLGFDRRGIRREFAARESLDLTDKRVRTEDRRWIDPRSVDMPYGPTGMGETGGSGMELYIEEGDQWQTYRFTHGFSVLQEDIEASNETVQQQRDEVIEIFDFFADSLFLTGLDDRAGNQIRKGVFQYAKDNIPSARTIDCEDFDGDAGDDDYTDGQEQNVLFYDAYSSVSGNLLTDTSSQWELMIGRQSALSNFNKVPDAARDSRTYWERINDESAIGGVQNFLTVPDQQEYPYTPEGVDPLTTDLTSELGTDEVLLFPDMSAVRENYWRLMEMDEPRAFPMHQQGGGQARQDYAWRYVHFFNPKGHKRWGSLEDAVHLKNVSVLFQ